MDRWGIARVEKVKKKREWESWVKRSEGKVGIRKCETCS